MQIYKIMYYDKAARISVCVSHLHAFKFRRTRIFGRTGFGRTRRFFLHLISAPQARKKPISVTRTPLRDATGALSLDHCQCH